MKDIELFNDHFQNFKAYGIPKAQLIIADVPYNLGANAYASRPAEFMHFCSQMLRKDKPIKEEKSEGGEDRKEARPV